MYYIVLHYITLYNIVEQPDEVCLCPLHCVVIIYSNFQYIKIYYSIFCSIPMSYSLLQHITAYDIVLLSNIV